MKTIFGGIGILTLAIIMGLCLGFGIQAHAYEAGADFYINDMYDNRTYDSSHPEALVQNTLGGWIIGLTIIDPAMQAEIGHVQINGHNGDSENPITTLLVNTPDVYQWIGGVTFNDYGTFIGAKFLLYDTYDIGIFKLDGTPMTIVWNGEQTEWVTVMPGKTNAQPPICKIKKMAIMKSGELKMRFLAPYNLNADHIRIRIFDAAGNAIHQIIIQPPFQIVKKDGTIIPDKVKTFIPAEYIGHTGRIEYRTNGIDGWGGPWAMLRGITFFKLPELEEE